MKLVPVSKVAEFINGRAFKPEEWELEGLPIIRIQNLTGSTNITNYYSGRVETKYLVKDGDILISWSASLGVYIWEGGNAILNQHIFKVVIKEDVVDKMYFYYAAHNALNAMIAQVHGATMQHITRDPFLAIEIPLPPLPEQRRIANLLSRLDHLRRLRRYGDTLSASLLQSVFLEMFGNPKYNSKSWELSLAGDLFKKIGYGVGTPPPFTTSGLLFLRAMNIKPNRIKLDNVVYFSAEYEKEMSRSRVNTYDIVVVRRGANTGDTAVIPPEFDGVYVGYDLILRPDHKKLNSYYFVSLLNTTHVRGYLYQIRERAAQQGLNAEQLSDLVIPIPPLPEQEQFAAVVRRVESLRRRQAESTRQVEGLFQALLAQSFRSD